MFLFWNKPDIVMTENVKELDKQIAELHAKYKAAQFSEKKFKRLILPITQLANRNSWKTLTKKIFLYIVILFSIVGVFYMKPTNRLISGVTKKFMVHQVS